jgi:hypothetical protein
MSSKWHVLRKRLLFWCILMITIGTIALATSCTRRERLADRSLLTDSPCAAPCWQGIIPGKTSKSQAIQILRNNMYVKEDSLQEAGTSEWGGATWQWRVPGRRLQPGISWQDDTVQEITLGLTYDLTIEQVVNKFGPPEALIASKGGVPEHWYWIINLYYSQIGVQFKAYTREFSSLLEPSTQVGVAQLFAPISLEERIANVYGGDTTSTERILAHEMDLIRPWKGYGDLFEIYYASPEELLLNE